MNRFKETIDDLSKRRSGLVSDDLQKEGQKVDSIEEIEETRWKLPYSTDPEPIGEAWSN
jgi:hypothetical protein